ncbi:hypothetical protein EVA_14765 [gut metagenome]|uniref:Uncharacterized protein n=1 Tax=gut metagenome TaxID=749906 RepID=J9G5Q1_9ZZZZ
MVTEPSPLNFAAKQFKIMNHEDNKLRIYAAINGSIR